MTSSSTISVIALDSQAYPLHPKTLYSLFTQQLDDWELFLITDTLSDPIEEITRRANDTRITTLSGHTTHLMELWNTALQQASGDFVTYLSSGLVYFPTHLQTLAQSLIDHDDVALAYTGMDISDRDYHLHLGGLMHHRFEDLTLDHMKEDPLADFWEKLHNKGSFARIGNTTWDFVQNFDQSSFHFPIYSSLGAESTDLSN